MPEETVTCPDCGKPFVQIGNITPLAALRFHRAEKHRTLEGVSGAVPKDRQAKPAVERSVKPSKPAESRRDRDVIPTDEKLLSRPIDEVKHWVGGAECILEVFRAHPGRAFSSFGIAKATDRALPHTMFLLKELTKQGVLEYKEISVAGSRRHMLRFYWLTPAP